MTSLRSSAILPAIPSQAGPPADTGDRIGGRTQVRLRIQPDHEIMHRASDRVLRGRKLVKFWILQIKIALPHRALHIGDGVTHHAAQPALGSRLSRAFRFLKESRITMMLSDS